MGKPEEVAGLVKKGFDPFAISAILGISSASVLDYLFRALGRRYISASDIVLCISSETRNQIDRAIEELSTQYWFDIYRHLDGHGIEVSKEQIQMYLHFRGTIPGDFYFLITELERHLYEIATSKLGPDLEYRYFSDLVRAYENSDDLLSEIEPYVEGNIIQSLRKGNSLRNRTMHPVPQFDPSDEDYVFIRKFSLSVRNARYGKPTEMDAEHLGSVQKIVQAADDALANSKIDLSELIDVRVRDIGNRIFGGHR